MPITHPTDSNGITYNAINTADWYGAEGIALRAQGWAYCGFGTWGVYIRPPGVSFDDCYKRTVVQKPNILPPAPQADTGGAASSVPLVTDKACGSCRRHTTTTAPAMSSPSVTVPTQPGVKVVVKKSGLPWWVILLALLLAAKVVGDE